MVKGRGSAVEDDTGGAAVDAGAAVGNAVVVEDGAVVRAEEDAGGSAVVTGAAVGKAVVCAEGEEVIGATVVSDDELVG